MSASRTPVVEHGTLTLGRLLGQGGQGSVHQVLNKKINTSVNGGWDVVYKEYAPAVLPSLDASALAAQVALTASLSTAEGRWLCEKTAWPAAVVERAGHPCGLLMRLVPDRFQFAYRSLGGASRGDRRLANLEFLLNDDAYVAGVGLRVSERDRVLLLADLAATLTRLHRIGIAVGDLSPKNLLFTTAARPECFLVDCDAMRLRGASALPQAETPDWQIPAGEEKATPSSDSYKLALLAVRLFARDQTATDPAALAALDPTLGDLARAGLSADPARRPAPAAWAERLTAVAATASAKAARRPASAKPAPKPPAPPSPRGPGSARPPGTPAAARPPGGPGSPRVPGGTGPGGSGSARVPALRKSAGRTVAVVAALIAVAVLFGLRSSGDDGSSTAQSTTSSGQSSTGGAWTGGTSADDSGGGLGTPDDTDDTDDDTGDGTSAGGGDDTTAGAAADSDADEDATESPSPTPDPVGDAEVGSCFDDEGTRTRPDLASTSCSPGAFKVVDIRHGTTDLDSCDGVDDSDESVSSHRHDLVLCLSYLNPGGDAYHAGQGDCVYGPNGSGTWYTEPCETGNFKVLAVYQGRNKSKCDGWPHYNLLKPFSGPSGAGLDRILCLSMNYPDAMGYAQVRQCLLKSGSGSDATFTNTGSCDSSNVVVSGRTGRYEAASFCGNDGWTTWRSREYPELAYTVCYRWR
ncbi:LppU/SCO3897 family protein [Streptomyces sp. 2-6]|uniref:LppU/SCO3897 family protein n=1 Tax=Streptomyces sp. 2-6 TaxID=2978333 RepID=UPI003D0FB1E4